MHVPGRPDWIFVKVFAHGISSEGDAEATLGRDFDSALRYLETRYNDGTRYVLHYVTAREAYNIVRAAMDGMHGDPEAYRDWDVKPYVAGRRDDQLPGILLGRRQEASNSRRREGSHCAGR